MPRPKSPHPKVKMHFALPQETVALLRLKFFTDDTATGVIQGAMSAFVNQAILDKLDQTKEEGIGNAAAYCESVAP